VQFDALLLLSFGGPDGPEDVMPFLDNVLRGRPVRPERVSAVASHYQRFGGRSPINAQNRALLEALSSELALSSEFDGHGRLYWGNRNWKPYLADTVAQMRDEGVERAAVFVTSAYSSYSSCRQYVEDLDRARREVGAGAPELLKLRPYFDHPGFVQPLAEGLRAALGDAGPGSPVLMSAHSIPQAMADASAYEAQLAATASMVARHAGVGPGQWRLVYQSRSGPPAQPWLGPDVLEAIAALPDGTADVVVSPIGFVSDHMEVVYDLDTEAAESARRRGIRLIRAATPGVHPRFVHMVCELLDEIEDSGDLDATRNRCPPGCCIPAATPGGELATGTRLADR
jgi:ferrochelatase